MVTGIVIGVIVTFVILLCIALAIANFSFENFQDTQDKLDQIGNSAQISTLQFVQQINKNFFHGNLTLTGAREYQDFYSAGRIGLSERTTTSNSLASLAVVSHELGHARQDATSKSLKKLARLRRNGRFWGVLFTPFLVTAVIFCFLWILELVPVGFLWAGCGCACGALLIFLFSLVIKWREIAIERQASDFALEFLRTILTEDEVKQCKKLLDSARLTYWAGFLRTLLWWTGMSKKGQMFK